MNVIITQLHRQDRQQWQTLYHLYAEFYKVPMNAEILDRVWSWIFDEDNQFFCFVAKNISGEILGFAHCREMPSPLRGAVVGFLDDLYVKQQYRGTGCVQALYQALQNFARKKNWPLIRWITAENNYTARTSYDKVAEKTHWLTYQMSTHRE